MHREEEIQGGRGQGVGGGGRPGGELTPEIFEGPYARGLDFQRGRRGVDAGDKTCSINFRKRQHLVNNLVPQILQGYFAHKKQPPPP